MEVGGRAGRAAAVGAGAVHGVVAVDGGHGDGDGLGRRAGRDGVATAGLLVWVWVFLRRDGWAGGGSRAEGGDGRDGQARRGTVDGLSDVDIRGGGHGRIGGGIAAGQVRDDAGGLGVQATGSDNGDKTGFGDLNLRGECTHGLT